jgi:GAF domain-containing protein
LGATLLERLRTSLPQREQEALDKIGQGAPLREILDDLLGAVEAESPDLLASILLLSADGQHLEHGSAPSLPQAYCEAIDGIRIGPKVGSCGTAAYLGHPVYVIDVATDPLWADFRELALSHGLRACWSTPIEGDDGKILGTFAIYHRAPRSPTPEELVSINLISRSAALAIQRRRARG